jgi:ribosome biogenesis protein Tsr3
LGKKTSTTSLNKLTSWIKKNIQEYNIVLLTNIEISSSPKSKKSDEHVQIAKYIQSSSTPLLTLFKKIGDIQKKKPEIIAYVNPQNYGKTASLMTRYICAVG